MGQCVLNNWNGYCSCMEECLRGTDVSKMKLMPQNNTDMGKCEAPPNENDRTAVRQLVDRIGIKADNCDYYFVSCNNKCTDCVDCRRKEDKSHCEFTRVKHRSDEKCIERYPGLEFFDCYEICPRKVMFPKCTSCCACYEYDEQGRKWRLARTATPSPTPFYGSKDYQETYPGMLATPPPVERNEVAE